MTPIPAEATRIMKFLRANVKRPFNPPRIDVGSMLYFYDGPHLIIPLDMLGYCGAYYAKSKESYETLASQFADGKFTAKEIKAWVEWWSTFTKKSALEAVDAIWGDSRIDVKTLKSARIKWFPYPETRPSENGLYLACWAHSGWIECCKFSEVDYSTYGTWSSTGNPSHWARMPVPPPSKT